MELNCNDISKYIENFLNNIFVEKIIIEIKDNHYIINGSFKMKIYKFWENPDCVLLYDFSNYKFQEDYINTMFFFLSGYWEYTHPNNLDEHGRYIGKESFSYKKGIINEPVVNFLVNDISDRLGLTYNSKYNSGKVFLTHDIDLLGMINDKLFIKKIIGDIIKRKDIKIAIDKLWRLFKRDDPHSVEKLIKLNNRYNAKGTFFFLPDVQLFSIGGGYSLYKNTEKLISLKNSILENGNSIGIHYDYRYLFKERLIDDIKNLEQILNNDINCGRAHYLMFDVFRSYNIFEKSGIKLDSSGGFADIIGFRFGTSFPFKPYDFRKNKQYNLVEVPLLIMDTTLQSYMKLSPSESLNLVKETINKITKLKGIFTILWHNTSFYCHGWQYWEYVYKETLDYINSKQLEFLTSNDIIMNEMCI